MSVDLHAKSDATQFMSTFDLSLGDRAKIFAKENAPTKGDMQILGSMVLITGAAILAMFGADHAFGTHSLDSFNSFWQHNWEHVLVAAGAAIIVGKLMSRMISKHKSGQSIKLDMLITTLVMGALTLGGLYYTGHVLNNNMMGDFNNFWVNHGVDTAVLTGATLATALIAHRVVKQVKEGKGSAKDVLFTLLAVAVVALGGLYYADHAFNTNNMTSFSNFWKASWINAAEVGLGGIAAYAIATRLYKKGFSSGDKRILAAIALIVAVTFGVLYGVDGVRHTEIMKPFNDFWKAEWMPMLEAGAVGFVLVAMISAIGTFKKRETLSRIVYAICISAVLVGVLSATWGGGNLQDLLNNHTWASLAGITLGVGLGVYAARHMGKKVRSDEEMGSVESREPEIDHSPAAPATPPLTAATASAGYAPAVLNLDLTRGSGVGSATAAAAPNPAVATAGRRRPGALERGSLRPTSRPAAVDAYGYDVKGNP